MRLSDFMEKIDSQASQLEKIGFKGDVLLNSIKQSVEKLIFKTETTEMNEDEIKAIKSFHDIKAFKVALDKYRELIAGGNTDKVAISEELARQIVKK